MKLSSNDHLKYYQDFLRPCHINVSHFIKTEKENKLPLSVLLVYIVIGSFLPSFYILGMVYTAVYSCYHVYSNCRMVTLKTLLTNVLKSF